ncbi:cell division ATP-binding protein FtsE [bacterium]|nr:cell division ATP-binding protein FtsE [bacterium]MBT3581757.1 cell division ATP-binding protein FtsE [bacterium]MBT4552661.1 cell division ATP-binding protein FtsE [bacterium]MBT5988119.1 cell division ATP-binding protein FtsE [bacterium]MBT7087610.1 cell division ATP-binding protein FtsE [bacterium]
MIEVRNVSKIYLNGFKALDNVNLSIGKEEFVYLVGPSGAGKSTLLKMIYKAEEPSSGKIFIDNFSLNNITERQIPYLRRNIGIVFQDYKLLPKRTVYENVAFALRVMHYSRSKIRRQVSQVLELVGLHQKMSNLPQELSGGEQQRICIARAIVNNPKILLADEPTGNLDPETSWEIMHLLTKINTRKTTVIVATHNKEIVDNIRKRVIALEKGKLVKDQQLGVYSTNVK